MLLLVKWENKCLMFENTKINLAESQKFLGDKAYKGEAAIITPQKKPKEW